MKTNKIEIDKLKMNLNWLYSKAGHYSRENSIFGDDSEFKRIWILYKEYRKELIKLDSNNENVLRNLEIPEPDNSNSFYTEHGGLFFKRHVEPLCDEIY